MGLTLSGTDTLSLVYEALAIYLLQPVPPTLALTAVNFDERFHFLLNVRFLSDTLARGRYIRRNGESGDIDVEIVDCVSGASAMP